jgi:hypothetical protein
MEKDGPPLSNFFNLPKNEVRLGFVVSNKLAEKGGKKVILVSQMSYGGR